jgi:hypothetical protein
MEYGGSWEKQMTRQGERAAGTKRRAKGLRRKALGGSTAQTEHHRHPTHLCKSPPNAHTPAEWNHDACRPH